MGYDYPRLTDNHRDSLRDVLQAATSSGDYDELAIATGYWDLPGMVGIIDNLRHFKRVRLLIGQEPLAPRLQQALNIQEGPDALFPDRDIAYDLEQQGNTKEADLLRSVAVELVRLMQEGVLEVRVMRKPRLHAKAYVFGGYDSPKALGIIGSSNFTKAGLTSNVELNYLEEDHTRVLYRPNNDQQGHGHLSWFDEMWESPDAEEWTGDFTRIVADSPVGNLAWGAYDSYIRTLMEVFPDELAPQVELGEDVRDVLYDFQDRNAGILLNKLQRLGVAMLADSVGLGKTITAGAVIKHWRDHLNAHRIVVIAPAALKSQWVDDLGVRFGLSSQDFTVLSLQDLNAIRDLTDAMGREWEYPADLFVIDEAHNLRGTSGARRDAVLDLLEAAPEAPVLLLTATPVNNSLMDFTNQIQLGLRDSLQSVPVQMRDSQGQLRTMDFIDACTIIQGEVRKQEKAGQPVDWDKYRPTLRAGLRHFLVRSTRQGVEAEGALAKNGKPLAFPTTHVMPLEYDYGEHSEGIVHDALASARDTAFEGIDPMALNVDAASQVTQWTAHPLDLYGHVYDGRPTVPTMPEDPDGVYASLFTPDDVDSLVPNVFRAVQFLGFTPYRPDLYRWKYRKKTPEQVDRMGLGEAQALRIRNQQTIHNILHVTWLKRLESSVAALAKSVDTYSRRLELFAKYLDMGWVVPMGDVESVEEEYGDDLERAFEDYERWLQDLEEALENGAPLPTGRRGRGVRPVALTPADFDVEGLYTDIARDRAILDVLRTMLSQLMAPGANGKIAAFAQQLKAMVANGAHGQKVLVFSFFADTVKYLQEALPPLMADVPDFAQRSAFVSGASGRAVEDAAARFSPRSKRRTLKPGERELDFLFATDVLSEGQNLQDAGMLVNYDLHWNPVRMIQRNGRINRLGSAYPEVLVVNARPTADLELYLRLVRRLETKIETIRNSVGTDQSVLGEDPLPQEFTDFLQGDEAAATSAVCGLEKGQGDLLGCFDTLDGYAAELRSFIKEHESDGEVQRVQALPQGKWNLLPRDAEKMGPGKTLALERVNGVGAVTGAERVTTRFVQVTQNGNRYRAATMDDAEALALIRTSPDDNKRHKETVPPGYDRTKAARRAKMAAKAALGAAASTYDPKPSEARALDIMAGYSGSQDILGIVQHGMQKRRDLLAFKKLVRRVLRDYDATGGVTASTQTDFAALMERLQAQPPEALVAQDVANVLFYTDDNGQGSLGL